MNLASTDLQPPMFPWICSAPVTTRGPKPETYLEKQRKSAARREGEGNSLKCCLWGWDLQLLEIPSLEAQLPPHSGCQPRAMPRARHYMQQGITAPWFAPPVLGTSGSTGNFLQEPVQKLAQMEKAESSWAMYDSVILCREVGF